MTWRDARDVEPARGDVRGDHHFVFAALEARERLFALALGAVECSAATECFISLSRLRDACRPRLSCCVKMSTLSNFVVSSMRDEQFELLVLRHGIKRVRHRLRGALPAADLDGDRDRVSSHLVIVSSSGGSVAEKNSVCRSFGMRSTIRDTSREEAHVEHAVHFIEHEVLDVARA